MNQAQIHLALNHIPFFLAITGGCILLAGLLKRNESFINLSLILLLLAGISIIPVYFTGEGTEEIAEHLPGVNERTIERHEEMAGISLISTAVTGILALAGLLFRRKKGAKSVWVTTAFASLVSFGIMAQTAHLGGLIRHTEIGGAAVSVTGDEKETKIEKNKKEDEKEADED